MRRCGWFLLILILAALCPTPSAPAQTAGANGVPVSEAAADEARLREEVGDWQSRLRGADGELDENAPAVQIYRGIEALLKAIDEHQARAAEFEQRAAEAPTRLEAIQTELNQPPAEPTIDPPADATLAQLEQRLAEARARVDAARQQVTDLAAEKSQRDAEMTAIPQRLASLGQQLEEKRADINAAGVEIPAAGNEPARANRLLLMAQRLALVEEISRLERQRASYEARRELLPKRQELAAVKVREAERLAAAWEQVVNARRQAEADRARQEAERLRREAARQHPVLKEFAEQSAELAKELNELQTPPSGLTVTQRVDAIKSRAGRLEDSMATLDQRVERADAFWLDDATGLALRRTYATIGDLDKVVRESEELADLQRDVEYRLQEVLAAQDEVRSETDALNELLERVSQDEAPVENQDDLVAVARDLVAARKDVLAKLEARLTNKSAELVNLQDAYAGLIETMRGATEYIEKLILWVRSVSGSPLPSVDDAGEGLRWFFDSHAWTNAVRASWSALRYHMVEFGSILLGLLALLAFRLRAPALLAHINTKIASFRTDRFLYTIRALLITVGMSLPVPALLWALAWMLSLPGDAGELALAAAGGFRAAAGMLFGLIFARAVLRDGGLGDRHFSWHTSGVRQLRRHLRWFIPLFAVGWGLVTALELQSVSQDYSDSLGRVCFIVAMIALSVFLARVLKPSGAVMKPILAEHEDRWLGRLRLAWYTLAVGLPLLLIALAIGRYYYTAIRLHQLLIATLWLVGVLVLCSALMSRWMFIARRRLAIESARRRREQLRAAAAAEAEAAANTGSVTPPPPPPPAIDPNEIDIPALDSKIRQAVRTGVGLAFIIGMALIWSEVLPALRMLDSVQLWPSPGIAEVERQAPSGPDARTGQGEVASPEAAPAVTGTPTDILKSPVATVAGDAFRLTLGDLGLAVLIGIIAVLAVRNLPAVIELILLEHLPLDAASRYALVSVFRYALALIGLTAAMGAMGISWSSVQWLAAALTFGLAFGLQEIFANFVSGLIILAERPIRVGDMVTVGQTDGTVTKIRMRATTILGWDRKELIIPNKAFITDRVINWTLSDSVQRIVVPVGVAYGSDLEKVERTLMEACRSVPGALEDPAPVVVYTGFGNSTLNWEARIYIPNLDILLSARTALYKAIDMAFRREGIEIAFPQMDLHIRRSPELDEILSHRSGGRPRPSAEAGPGGDEAG